MTPEQLESVRRRRRSSNRPATSVPAASTTSSSVGSRRASLFADDVMAQRDTLVDELVLLVAAADDLHGFLARARVLGLRHQRHGIHAADYTFLGEALIAAIADVVGEGWSAEAEASWRRMYALIAEAMLEGAEDGLFSPSG